MTTPSNKTLTVDAFHRKVGKIARTLDRPVRRYTPGWYKFKDFMEEQVTPNRVAFSSTALIFLSVVSALVLQYFFGDDPKVVNIYSYTLFSIAAIVLLPMLIATAFMAYSLARPFQPPFWFNCDASMGALFLSLRSNHDKLLTYTFTQHALLRWLGERDTLGEYEDFLLRQANYQFCDLSEELAQNDNISEEERFNAINRYISEERMMDDHHNQEAQWQGLQQQAKALRDHQVLKRDTIAPVPHDNAIIRRL